MTVEEARDILIHYNVWRRDDHVPNHYEMPNPTKLGVAIDVAIKVLNESCRQKRQTKKADEESSADNSVQLSLSF